MSDGSSSADSVSENGQDELSDNSSYEDETLAVGGRSPVTSIFSTSSFVVEQNGRLYASRSSYPLPVDEQAQDEARLLHLVIASLVGDMYLPLLQDGSRILDLACGSGTWAIDMGDKNPSCTVRGADIVPAFPEYVPPNVEFEIDDITLPPSYLEKFDFVHGNDIQLAIFDWSNFLFNCQNHLLNPGGVLQISGLIPLPHIPGYEEAMAHSFFWELRRASNRLGTPWDAPRHYKEMVEQAGFVNVQERIFHIPWSAWLANSDVAAMAGHAFGEWLCSSLPGMASRFLAREDASRLEYDMATIRKQICEEKNVSFVCL